MFETIVAGVDGREGGRDALALAGVLQRRFGSRVIAVHAYPHEFFVTGGAGGGAEAVLHGHAQAGLDKEVEAVAVDAIATAVPDSSPARALQLAAGREQADLIAVGSDHRGPIGRVVAGDAAYSTLTGAECAVAVAPRGLASGEPALKTIGVGFDGSLEARAALALARRMAEPGRSRLVLRYVVPQTGWSFASSYARLKEDAHDVRARAEEVVAEAVGDLGDTASGDVVEGTIAAALEEFSEQVDVLVVGSRGFGPVRRVFLGGAAHKLMRTAHCPVFILPRTAIDEEPSRHATAAESPQASR